MKRITSTIVYTSAILTTAAFCQEVIIDKSEPSVAKVKMPTKEAVAEDPAITTITQEILEPVRIQAKRMNTFSRRSYSPPSTYDLVEITSTKQEGARFFNIMVTPPKTKSLAFKISKQELKKDNVTTADAGPKPTVHLNIKYLSAANQVLIKQDHEWVEKSEHKYLKLLPVAPNKVVAGKK